jgi:O-acetyl-ADP-ribose deacetylase (regulator of RNase III)
MLIHDDGLAAALVDKGGSVIQEESNEILKKFGNPIPTGNVVATSGGSLPCKKVIHAVGPIYSKKLYECPF